jgi:hypothetical protein
MGAAFSTSLNIWTDADPRQFIIFIDGRLCRLIRNCANLGKTAETASAVFSFGTQLQSGAVPRGSSASAERLRAALETIESSPLSRVWEIARRKERK